MQVAFGLCCWIPVAAAVVAAIAAVTDVDDFVVGLPVLVMAALVEFDVDVFGQGFGIGVVAGEDVVVEVFRRVAVDAFRAAADDGFDQFGAGRPSDGVAEGGVARRDLDGLAAAHVVFWLVAVREELAHFAAGADVDDGEVAVAFGFGVEDDVFTDVVGVVVVVHPEADRGTLARAVVLAVASPVAGGDVVEVRLFDEQVFGVDGGFGFVVFDVRGGAIVWRDEDVAGVTSRPDVSRDEERSREDSKQQGFWFAVHIVLHELLLQLERTEDVVRINDRRVLTLICSALNISDQQFAHFLPVLCLTFIL